MIRHFYRTESLFLTQDWFASFWKVGKTIVRTCAPYVRILHNLSSGHLLYWAPKVACFGSEDSEHKEHAGNVCLKAEIMFF